MENNEFHQQEDAEIFPEEVTEIPAEPEALEPELPQEEAPNEPAIEEIPIEEPIELPVEEVIPGEPTETVPEEIAEEAPQEEFVPIWTDLSNEVPQEEPETTLFEHPEVGDEITADEGAMAFHGMLHPSEPEPSFDMSVLDDPELTELMEDTATEEFPAPPEEPPLDQEYRDNGEDFDAAFNAPAQEMEIPTHDRPARKGRPKRKHRDFLFGLPGIAAVAIWLAIILAVGVTLGRMVWVCAADVLAFGREDKPVTITVYQSDSIDIIADKLHKGGLIKYPGLFKFYASLAVDEGEIQPGIWDLNTRYDYHALVSMMSASSTREVVKITIPEGYSCRQIFSLLEENKVATAIDLGNWAAEGELDDYWFLENVERDDAYSLEGFLFPDTYEFYKNSSPREALERMLDNFEYRFDEEMQAQIATLNDHISTMMRNDGRSEEYIAAHQFGIGEVVIVASLIEKETAGDDESPMIASVIYNRLFNWGNTPAYLNIDASVIYALDGKTDLTAEDLRVDSPYNTYLYTGLTPGAITNPGLASIKAALNPAESEYYFYVLDPAVGAHHFSTTYEEHNEFIATLE